MDMFRSVPVVFRTSSVPVLPLSSVMRQIWFGEWPSMLKKCHILTILHERKPLIANYTLGQEQLSVVDSYPYLGVTISSDLRWHKHVDSLSAKATRTRTLNFVRRNIYRCPPDVKTLAYTSLIKPHLEFASAAWDPYTARDINQLDNNVVVRILLKRLLQNDICVWSCQRPRISVPGKLQEECPLASFLKGLHGLSAILCDSLCRPVHNSRHTLTDTFTVLSSRIDCYKYSFCPRTISEWNKLMQDVRSELSMASFRTALLNDPGPVENNFWAMALWQ